MVAADTLKSATLRVMWHGWGGDVAQRMTAAFGHRHLISNKNETDLL